MRQYSEETARRIDEAVKVLLEEQRERVVKLLTEKRDVLERVTQALLEYETLNAEQFVRVVEGLPGGGTSLRAAQGQGGERSSPHRAQDQARRCAGWGMTPGCGYGSSGRVRNLTRHPEGSSLD